MDLLITLDRPLGFQFDYHKQDKEIADQMRLEKKRYLVKAGMRRSPS